MTIVIKSIKSRSKTLKEGQNLLDEGLIDSLGARLRKITNSQTQEEKDAAIDAALEKAEDLLQGVQGKISSLESENTGSVDTWPNSARLKMQRLKQREEKVEKAIRKIMGDPDPPPAAPTPTAAAAAATTLYTNAGNALKQVRRGRQREAMIDAIVDLLDQLGSSGAGQDFRDHLQTHRISGGRT